MRNIFTKSVLVAVSTLMVSFGVSADTSKEEVRERIASQNQQFPIEAIRVNRELSEYGMEGFYEVNIGGQDLIASPSGRYLIIGDLFDLRTMRNLSEEVRNEQRGRVAGEVISRLDKAGMVKFSHNDDVSHIGDMYVFTDPTCPFCHRVHEEMDQYQQAGVNVYYIPYPRSGVNGGQDYNMLKNIICADDQQQAMNDYKAQTAGNKYQSAGSDQRCHDFVAAGYNAGQEIGVTGTPFIYLSNGQSIPGYNPADAIIQRFSQ